MATAVTMTSTDDYNESFEMIFDKMLSEDNFDKKVDVFDQFISSWANEDYDEADELCEDIAETTSFDESTSCNDLQMGEVNYLEPVTSAQIDEERTNLVHEQTEHETNDKNHDGGIIQMLGRMMREKNSGYDNTHVSGSTGSFSSRRKVRRRERERADGRISPACFSSSPSLESNGELMPMPYPVISNDISENNFSSNSYESDAFSYHYVTIHAPGEIGLVIHFPPPDLAQSEDECRINKIVPNGQASLAGLRVDDVIVDNNSRFTLSFTDGAARLRSQLRPLNLTVRRKRSAEKESVNVMEMNNIMSSSVFCNESNESSSRHQLKVPTGRSEQEGRLKSDVGSKVSSPKSKKEEKKSWELMYDLLAQYHTRYGDCLVPAEYSENPKLGRWVRLQRQKYKHRTEGKQSPMSDSRIAALEALGFTWSINKFDDWTEMYHKLLKYREQHGDCNVPATYVEDHKLGRWVSMQRHYYKQMINGKPSSMTSSRVSQLKKINFSWTSLKRDDWKTMYEELCDYYAKFGDCLVSQNSPDYPKLGNWVCKQRQEKKRGTMQQDRIDALNAIDFAWSVAGIGHWNEMYKELVLFVQRHGHANVPSQYPSNPKLSRWVSQQRYFYKRLSDGKSSPMVPNRIEDLEKLGLAWSVSKSSQKYSDK